MQNFKILHDMVDTTTYHEQNHEFNRFVRQGKRIH
jgi:hypothetical protein